MKDRHKFLEKRAPISNLEQDIPYFNHLDTLSAKFNMYRRISTDLLTLVINYCYVEHLARPYTSRNQLNKFFHRINRKQVSSLDILKKLKKHKVSNGVHQLEDSIEECLLIELPMQPMLCYIYKSSSKEITIEESEPVDSDTYPICYLLENESRYYVLYTPMMSFIDGYDFYTGERRLNILPHFYLDQARKELVRDSKEKKSSSEADSPRFSSGDSSGDTTKKSKHKMRHSDTGSRPKENSDSDYTSQSKSSSGYRSSLQNSHSQKDQMTISSKVSSLSSHSSKIYNTYSSEDNPFTTDEEEIQRPSVEHNVGARVFSVETSPAPRKIQLYNKEEREDDWFYCKLDTDGVKSESIYPRTPQRIIQDRNLTSHTTRVDLCSKPCVIF